MTREEIIAANPIVEFVRNRGHELKPAGQNFVTNGCPVTVHAKKWHRPVGINVEKQVWYCNDCKLGGTVIDWVMREKRCAAAAAMRELGGGGNDSDPRREFVCAYDYSDERGKLLSQAVRYKVPPPKEKHFLQRRPNGKGGWIWDMEGVRRVLYRLREVIAAETVVVVEGEKDADTLAKLGFTTTTNIGGAGKWRDEYSETLRGKNVIVIGDNDETGRKHVAQVIESLTGVARTLRHVILPAEFKDVADVILSMTVEQASAVIKKLIADALEIEPPEPVGVEVAQGPPPYVPPPLDLFPDKMQRFIRAGAATYDVNPAFFVLPVLSGAAAMIGHSRSIRLKEDYIEPSIIWTATIAPTGDGKSPVLQAAVAAVRLREIGLIKKNKDADKTFKDEFAKWDAKTRKERAGEKQPEKPALLTCWLDDATTEAAALRLKDNPRGVLLPKDEFSHWFESMDQYHDKGGADVSRWLSVWTGHLFALDRVSGNRSYRITNPRLSITGGIVPDKFQHLLTEDFFVRGLPARFLFAMPTRNQPRKWVDKNIPKEIKAAVNELFARLAELEPHKDEEHDEESPVLLGLTPEAKEIFVDFYNECARRAFDADVREAAQWSKLSAYSARLALVGQLMRDPEAKIVTADTMRAACELARWFGNEAERIYALIAETPEQRANRKLVRFIERRGGRVTERDVYTNYSPLKNKPTETKVAIEKLRSAGHGEWEDFKPEGRGRPTRVFRLHPVSASAQFPDTPSVAPNTADADIPSSQENEAATVWDSQENTISAESDIEADVFQSSTASASAQIPISPSITTNSADADSYSVQENEALPTPADGPPQSTPRKLRL